MTSSQHKVKYIGHMAEAVIHPWKDVVFKKDVEIEVSEEVFAVIKNKLDFEVVDDNKEVPLKILLKRGK